MVGRNGRDIDKYLEIDEHLKFLNPQEYNEIIEEYNKLEEKYIKSSYAYEICLKKNVEKCFRSFGTISFIERGKHLIVFYPVSIFTFKRTTESPYELVGKWHIEETYGDNIDNYVKDFIDYEGLGKFWVEHNKEFVFRDTDDEIVVIL